MSEIETLSEAVDAIAEQAERKENAENIDDKVATAQRTISDLNGEVEHLAEAVNTLQFYRKLLDEMFDGNEPPGVESALEEAKSAVQIDKTEIVDDLVENTEGGPGTAINARKKDVTSAEKSVSTAIETVKDRLRGYQREWEERLSSARDLQEIIGGQHDEFGNTVTYLENIVTKKMWDPDRTASTVITEWENATNRWENHQDLQGLDAFQQTHGLSDNAIDAVERLSSHSDLTLADVDVDVLAELKRIDQLADTVELSI